MAMIFLGHSRTIIGFEQFRDGNIRLLIFDPGTPKTEIDNFFQNPYSKAHLFRRSLQSFQKPVYQILVVRGLLRPEEREVPILISRPFVYVYFLRFHRLQNIFVRLRFRCPIVDHLIASETSLLFFQPFLFLSSTILQLIRIEKNISFVVCSFLD